MEALARRSQRFPDASPTLLQSDGPRKGSVTHAPSTRRAGDGCATFRSWGRGGAWTGTGVGRSAFIRQDRSKIILHWKPDVVDRWRDSPGALLSCGFGAVPSSMAWFDHRLVLFGGGTRRWIRSANDGRPPLLLPLGEKDTKPCREAVSWSWMRGTGARSACSR
jgi:hypothetical protein